jgi:hypothetical protein
MIPIHGNLSWPAAENQVFVRGLERGFALQQVL